MWQEVAGFPGFELPVREREVGVEDYHNHEAVKGPCAKQNHLRTIRNIIFNKGTVRSLFSDGITDHTVKIRISRWLTQNSAWV